MPLCVEQAGEHPAHLLPDVTDIGEVEHVLSRSLPCLVERIGSRGEHAQLAAHRTADLERPSRLVAETGSELRPGHRSTLAALTGHVTG